MILCKFFRKIKDLFFISKSFFKREIIIRILVCPKQISESGEIPERKLKDYFIPLNGGVSVNRYRYISEKKSKVRGREFNGYRGFALFTFEMLEDSLSEYLTAYPKESDFLVNLKATPLNVNNKIIESKFVHRLRRGNLSHADIIFPKAELETPSIYYRNFSRILAKNSKKVVDEHHYDKNWKMAKFNILITSDIKS